MADTTTTTTTFCGFPKRFSSEYESDDDTGNLYYYLNRLWQNAKTRLIGGGGDYGIEHVATVDGQTYQLPGKLPEGLNFGGCADIFVDYLQDLLDLNGHADMHIILDHQDSFDFEILTKDELLAKLEFPLEEYRYDGGLMHPKICYTYAWVSKKTGKMFTPGDLDDFPHDSIAWRGGKGLCDMPECPKCKSQPRCESPIRCVSPDPSVAQPSEPFQCGSCE